MVRPLPGVVAVTAGAGDFLLELRSEEIPARMQAGARAELERLFRQQMEAAAIAPGPVTVWSTPRRLALIARGLPPATKAVREETKGPRSSAPPQALDGFLRKTGLARDQLEERDGVFYAVVEKPGRPVREVLAEAVPAIVRAFAWPKSMRWGAASLSTGSLRWVRPLSGIVAILGEELVEFAIDGVPSGYATVGHRFHHPGAITIGGAHDYADKLRACHVIVDQAEREATIREGAARVAAEAGLTLIADEGLVVENAGLTEWPVPLLGRFDAAFLEVPPEVIQLTARTNQKYFVCERDGRLANAFVCTANIEPEDGGAAIVDGNRKVLAARLADARFFWEQDRRKTLAEHARGLERITFHEKLGTVADKIERVAKLARWLLEEGIVKPSTVPAEAGASPGQAPDRREIPASAGMTKGELADYAEQAARLCKADLVTEMVGEFPELQGLMGGYYARAEGLPDAVADAIRDHYKPVGQNDEVLTAPVTVAVSLADKLDTLIEFFAFDMAPTGSKDPFALRRAALGVIATVVESGLRLSLSSAFRQSRKIMGSIDRTSARQSLNDFLADRLKVQQREAGVRHDLIDAVFALGNEDDLVRLLARVKALQNFIATPDGANLLAAYKRAANILKKENWHGTEGQIAQTGEEDPLALVDDPDLKAVIDAKMAQRHAGRDSYAREPAEQALIDALDAAEPRAAAAVAAEDFEGAMAALASLRAPIDRFFEEVTVNDPDQDKRSARLDLLARFRAAVHNVADFSQIEG
ncbi:MAG: glycine--tRNA ligase subunit beta [Porphyrobacter sp.]|nr:glycine--tRNA ligase subunit beta [Porphyrobacter sp.]